MRTALATAGMLLGTLAPGRAAAQPVPPSPAALAGWAELDLRIDTAGATVEVDSGQFCAVPCSMLLLPGEHTFTLSAPELEPRILTRTLEDGRSLRIDGDLAGESTDALSVMLYVLGAAALLTGMSLACYDVAMNVGYAQSDWTISYVAAGVAPLGLILAIWGAARGGGEPEELAETVVPF